MFKHILVPLDGSGLSEASIPESIFLAGKLKAEITLLHIVEQDAPQKIHGDHHLKTYDEAISYLNGIVKKRYPTGLKVKIHVHANDGIDVVRAIASHHKEIGSDLLVMATHGWGGFKEIIFGNNAQQIINLGIMPVLFVPRLHSNHKRPISIDRILVPVELTEEHRSGFDVATAMASVFSAKLFIMNVIPTMKTLSSYQTGIGILLPAATKEILNLQEEEAAEYIAEKKTAIEKLGIKVHAEICRGYTAETINTIADKHDINLIIIGTHGKAGLNAFWSGSVAAKITGKTTKSILFVPIRTNIDNVGV